MDEITEQNKKLLEHGVLKEVARFLQENPDVYHMSMYVQTLHPLMTLTEDGKCHTGRIVVVEDRAINEEEYNQIDDGYYGDNDDDE